jgi:hypothetical protein
MYLYLSCFKGWFSLKDAPKGRVLVEITVARAMDKVRKKKKKIFFVTTQKETTMLLCESIRTRCRATGGFYFYFFFVILWRKIISICF